ncbi:flagellin [Sulfurimonas sp.]|jgi:flagellin|uniref:flagellin N-terminal helical domain-containing protein n=1 Tax=Sulfurimonas sp. TaxID=2022749 RepID=UPI0025DC00E5|nr:flagellin [Sulfurimonas sp.]MCK9472199.1 flagellin B [Sulfurimonas sp.]MDD3504975.1 flagellin [Sulfurimonas sp.]
MGFRINTNIGAMDAHRNATMNNVGLDKSLASLSSGLRINKAADDASGLAIANSLKAQSTGLGQAISNANDGIGVAQTADGALEEYGNIINTIRTKSIQASSDGQNTDSRMAIQRDISKLLEAADSIAKTTQFNGIKLLDGSFVDKNFQVGAYANETVGVSIDSARTATLGQFALKEGTAVTNVAFGAADFTVNGTATTASVAGTDTNLNALAQTADSARQKAAIINSITSTTGVTADANTDLVGGAGVAGGTISANSVFINGVDLGEVTFSSNDSSGTLAAAFNRIQNQTGVTASIVDGGKLQLTSADGNNITLSNTAGGGTVALAAETAKMFGAGSNVRVNSAVAGALTEVSRGTIELESNNAITTGGGAVTAGGFTASTYSVGNAISSSDVTTYDAAQLTIKKADHALAQLDKIRSNIGSTQNQLESTIRNIAVTQVNVSAAESNIRDVDFAAESAKFAKHNILAQSGAYAMSQANAVQQNVLRLLQ